MGITCLQWRPFSLKSRGDVGASPAAEGLPVHVLGGRRCQEEMHGPPSKSLGGVTASSVETQLNVLIFSQEMKGLFRSAEPLGGLRSRPNFLQPVECVCGGRPSVLFLSLTISGG